ncbi:alpha-ribazole phosphatase family protein [uncultured Sunxiuqinia sp.]|uniref:alpha-ribazole phosphatase family protein n=1 Tax=uncultured Sunxiuqinia sp. TaxID=1573825 RepID=UPI002AA8ECF0|nr:alpha-ribazole phosphatase family protein [uncultured Sunxiuqinia sp.]
MKLYCIRHTKVDVPPGICYGQSDVGLAESYPTEQIAVLQQIPSVIFDRVYSSPLSRCRMLADDLFPEYEITCDDRLKELNFGNWELHQWEEISQTDEAKAWFDDFVHVRCPRGEAFIEQIERAESFIIDLLEQPHDHVLLVTHGGILRSLDCLLNEVEPLDSFKRQFGYGQLVIFSLNSFKKKQEI